MEGRMCQTQGTQAAAPRVSRIPWAPVGWQDPELGDDTFLLVGRMLAYSPRLVMAPAPLAALLDTAAAGLLVQHKCGRATPDMLLSRSVLLLKAHLVSGRMRQSMWVSSCPPAPALHELTQLGWQGWLERQRQPPVRTLITDGGQLHESCGCVS